VGAQPSCYYERRSEKDVQEGHLVSTAPALNFDSDLGWVNSVDFLATPSWLGAGGGGGGVLGGWLEAGGWPLSMLGIIAIEPRPIDDGLCAGPASQPPKFCHIL
jgi:hypothetical protein